MIDFKIELKKDLLEQFRDKNHIEDFVEVVGTQLNEVYAFFEELVALRAINNAEGIQLDRIGDIVVLTRKEAAILAGFTDEEGYLNDATYRKYLIYKILKNTCNSTYYDILKCMKMFWGDHELKYREDPKEPATIIFDFDASPDLNNENINTPLVKAAGVKLHLKMHQESETSVYAGVAFVMGSVATYECDEAVIEPNTYLSDADGLILTSENNEWLIE